MICLEVVRNDKRLCLAGLPEPGCLSLNLFLTPPKDGASTLDVAGWSETHAMSWVEEKIMVGDAVTFRIVEAAEASQPKSNVLVPAGQDEARARKQYDELTWQLQQLEEQWGEKLGKPRNA